MVGDVVLDETSISTLLLYKKFISLFHIFMSSFTYLKCPQVYQILS